MAMLCKSGPLPEIKNEVKYTTRYLQINALVGLAVQY